MSSSSSPPNYRIIALIDMDCFYAQVEQESASDETLRTSNNRPCAVVQYNQYAGGIVIAVNYEARALGVKRGMRGDEASKLCPSVHLFQVPENRGKANLTKYRDASAKVMETMSNWCSTVTTETTGKRKREGDDDGGGGHGQVDKLNNEEVMIVLERASIDEAYLDLTKEVRRRMMNFNAMRSGEGDDEDEDEVKAMIEQLVEGNTFLEGFDSGDIETIQDEGENLEENIDVDVDDDDDDQSKNENVESGKNNRQSHIINERALLKKWITDTLNNSGFDFNSEIGLALAIGAQLVSQLRSLILKETGYKCSAGIACNKMLAKLAAGIHKPNGQTILPPEGVNKVMTMTPIGKVRNLGGKLGDDVKKTFKISMMNELAAIPVTLLTREFGDKTGLWLNALANGHEDEAVTPRQLAQSIGCGKNFPGKQMLKTPDEIRHWVKQLCAEIVERLIRDRLANKRSAKLITVGVRWGTGDHVSRSVHVNCTVLDNGYYDEEKVYNAVIGQVFNKIFEDSVRRKINLVPISNLSMIASKFVDDCSDAAHGTKKLDNYFTKIDKNGKFIGPLFEKVPIKVVSGETVTVQRLRPGAKEYIAKFLIPKKKEDNTNGNENTTENQDILPSTSEPSGSRQASLVQNISTTTTHQTSKSPPKSPKRTASVTQLIDLGTRRKYPKVKHGFFFRKARELRKQRREKKEQEDAEKLREWKEKRRRQEAAKQVNTIDKYFFKGSNQRT